MFAQAKKIFLWGAATWLVFCASYMLYLTVQDLLQRAESAYNNPVGADKAIVLRNDDAGKGHYMASRDPDRFHEGIDIRGEIGDPIYASKSGRVTHAGPRGNYGLFVELTHADGLVSRYAHLSEVSTKLGEWVWQGNVIGALGKTGNAEGETVDAHVHFEILYSTQPLDPTKLISQPRTSKEDA